MSWHLSLRQVVKHYGFHYVLLDEGCGSLNGVDTSTSSLSTLDTMVNFSLDQSSDRQKKRLILARILWRVVTPETSDRCSMCQFHCMPMSEGCGSWIGVNAAMSCQLMQEYNVNLVLDWPSDGQQLIKVPADYVVYLQHPRHRTSAQPSHFHHISMTKGCGSWNDVNAPLSHLSISEYSIK